MGSYEINFCRSAEKELRNLDRQIILRIDRAIEALSDDPFPIGYRKLKDGEKEYRIRVGDYRVVYGVDAKEKRITIFKIRHRSEAYKNR
jgi:mRNA interferase RelE/StbE